MTDYEWLSQMGLCHKCRKNKAAPNKKFCFDCLDKIREESRKRYDPEKAREYQKRRREIYIEKKTAGICIRCSKKATQGMYCQEHFIKQRRNSAERAKKRKNKRHEKGLIKDERKEKGLCLWCGKKTLPGLQCCEKHREIFSIAGKKGKESSEWNKR